MTNSIEIHEYTGYFHDGAILDIIHTIDNMEIFMESAELEKDWIKKIAIPISKNNTIKGKLHIEKIKKIKENDQIINKLEKLYDDGDIYDFEIKNNTLLLVVSWLNYPPKPRIITPFFQYEIEAEKIYWENIP